MRITICDDCAQDVLALKKTLGAHDVRVYTDAASFLADVRSGKNKSELYLLDIFMEDAMDGIALARELRRAQEDAVICFISSSDGFYRQAYDLYALQYLLKPVRKEAVAQLLEKVSQTIARSREKTLSVQFRGQACSIPYGRILYISSSGHILSIQCTDKTVYKCTGTLNELAARVSGDVFMRCHQSFLVNMYHVDSLNGSQLEIGGQWIPVSRRYLAGVKNRYREILFEEVE